MKISKLLLLLSIAFGTLSCNNDDEAGDELPEVNCANFGSDTEVQAAIDAFGQAANVYIQDPSEANCVAYLDALDNYFVAVEIYMENCANNEAFTQYKTAIEEWRTERDQLDCAE